MSLRHRPRPAWILVVLGLWSLPSATTASPRSSYGRIELVRDSWGVPHVFSTTDAGAMYGLGYVTASERGFQMTYNLRIIQGRLAETIGDRPRLNGRETALAHDRKMRTFGWSQAADRTAPRLDPETRHLLDAYAEGVNDSFAQQKISGTLHPLFQELALSPEPWTPADCLLSWWHLAQFFATDGTRDLMVWRNRAQPRPNQPRPPAAGPRWVNDSAAVVQRGDVTDAWMEKVEAFRAAHPFKPAADPPDGPKFSHAWVVAGSKTTTGSAVLVSDPQTPVRNPSLWMEFHVQGKTFDARGVGIPGSPGLLIGFNRTVAWGLTALGADQADLFRLETDEARPDQYRWNGEWRSMTVRTEEIKVKNGPATRLLVRETHLGPIASAFAFRQPGDPEVAIKRVPLCESDRDTIQGALAMMRASNVVQFAEALAGWRTPSANCVYGDAGGRVGFATLGAIPLRPRSAEDPNGGEALGARGDADDWQGYISQDLLPQVVDPRAGLLWSANHRPIASFYPIPLGLSTGSMGDTIRSWRLRELLTAQAKFTPAEVLAVHYDSVNPARREIVRLGLHLQRTARDRLSAEALKALEPLEAWLENGASSDLKAAGAELAVQISTFFRFIATPLTQIYGGGESGLANYLQDAGTRVAADPAAQLSDDECTFINNVLSEAWKAKSDQRGGGRPANRRDPAQTSALSWFDSLDGFGSLDHKYDLTASGITCRDGQTIRSQAAQSYTQWVPLHEIDSAQTLCPIGHSDRPDSRFRTSTQAGWQEGKLHPAPLSRSAVEKLATERLVLAP